MTKSILDFKKQLSTLKVSGIEICNFESYRGKSQPIKFRCLRDANHPNFLRTPNYFLKKDLKSNPSCCPICSEEERRNKLRKTHKPVNDYLQQLSEKWGSKISLLKGQEIRGKHHKYEFVCNVNPLHGKFKNSIRNLLDYDGGCPKCSGKKKTSESVKFEIFEVLGKQNVDVIALDYKNSKSRVLLKCLQDSQHEYWSTQVKRILYLKVGCPACALEKLRINRGKKFQKKFNKIWRGKLEIVKDQKYINWETPLKFKCLVNKKHRQFLKTPTVLLLKNNPSGCPECGKLLAAQKIGDHFRLTKKQWESKLVLATKNRYKVERIEWKKNRQISRVYCICNTNESHLWDTPLGVLVYGKAGCPYCANVVKDTHEKFINKIKNVHGRKLELVPGQKYINQRAIYEWKCLTNPSHLNWKTTGDVILAGAGCKECYYESISISYNEFRKRVKEIHGSNIQVLTKKSEYSAAYKKILFKCLKDKYHGTWSVRGNQIYLAKSGCPKCADNRVQRSEFFERLKKVHKNRILLAPGQTYSTVSKKYNWSCNVNPNHPEWSTSATSVLQGHGCKKCHNEKYKIGYDEFLLKLNKVHRGSLEILTKKEDFPGVAKGDYGIFQCLKNPKHGKWKTQNRFVVTDKKTGCPKCGIIRGYIKRYEKYKDSNLRGLLYKLLIFDKEECFYKVGFTSRTIEKRFRNLFNFYKYKIVVIELKESNLYDVITEEQEILDQTELIGHVPYSRYHGRIMPGKSECFEVPEKFETIQFGLMGMYEELPIISYKFPKGLLIQLNS